MMHKNKYQKYSILPQILGFQLEKISSIYYFQFCYNYIIIIHMLSQDLIQSYLDSQLSQQEVQKCHQKFLESIQVIKQKNDRLEAILTGQDFLNQYALSSVFRREKSQINYLLNQLQLFEKILPKIYKQLAEAISPSIYHKIIVNNISKEIRRFKQLIPIQNILNIYNSKISQSKIMHSAIIEEEEHQKEIYKSAEEMRRPKIRIESSIDDRSQILVQEQSVTQNSQRNSADEKTLMEQIQLLGKLYQFGKFTQSQCQDQQNEKNEQKNKRVKQAKKKQTKQSTNQSRKNNSIRETMDSASVRTSIYPDERENRDSVIQEEPDISWKQIGLRQTFRKISQNRVDSRTQKIIKAALFIFFVILAFIFLCCYFAFKLFNSLTGSL